MSELVGSALGLEGAIAKTGFLQKRAKRSGTNWRRRYFVLKGSSLVYYESNKKLDAAKGDLLLTSDCVIRDVAEAKYPNCFEIVSGFETLRVSAATAEEGDEWKRAIEETVAKLCTQRGFLDLKVKQFLFISSGEKWARKFVVLHSNAITYHHDHYSTYKKQGEFPLEATSKVRTMGLELQVVDGGSINRGASQKTITLRARDRDDLETWRSAVEESIRRLVARDALASKRGHSNEETIITDGYLATQPLQSQQQQDSSSTTSAADSSFSARASASASETSWPTRFYALTESALYQAEEEDSPDALDVFAMEPGISVWPTKFRPHSFEIVTSTTVLHVSASSEAEAARWIAHLRAAASNAPGLSSDPLYAAVMEKEAKKKNAVAAAAAKKRALDDDANSENHSENHSESYAVHYEAKQKLRVVLERANEWAVVKSVKGDDNRVEEGSALVKVNGTSTTLQTYDATVSMLAGWEPPLTLTFLRAPSKRGWLKKQARGRNGRKKQLANWKTRFFHLEAGRLAYYADDPALLKGGGAAHPKDVISLTGCAVSLVSKRDQSRLGPGGLVKNKEFCFRVTFGVGEVVMQAATLEDMLSWATTLYRAAAVANGGGYLLGVERTRLLDDSKDHSKDKDSKDKDDDSKGDSSSSSETTTRATPRRPNLQAEKPVALQTSSSSREEEAAPPPKKTEEKKNDDDHATVTASSSSEQRPGALADKDDGDDDDDDDEGAMSEVVGEAAASVLVEPLTDDELGHIYEVVDTEKKGFMNTMTFVALLRTVGASEGDDLKFELDLFSACDRDKTGSLTKDDFVAGLQAHIHNIDLAASPKVKGILQGIRAYQHKGTVQL